MHVAATAPAPLRDHDKVVLQLLQLAAEAILAHPRAVPPLLYEQCSTWADDLAGALSPAVPGAPWTRPSGASAPGTRSRRRAPAVGAEPAT